MAPQYYSRRPQRRRQPAHPMLMGEPSPALSKIRRMNIEKLNAYLDSTKVEIERLGGKVKNLTEVEPVNHDKIKTLESQQERLRALLDAAAEQLQVKHDRKQRYEAGDTRGRR
ncbi:MAG: hypothetical protein AAGC44_12295 [Planctomycetota bacterium]